MGSSPLRWLWALLHLAVLVALMMSVGVFLRAMPARVPAPSHMSVAYLLAAGIVIYTMLLSCFLDIGEPRQRRPTDVLILFMCFAAAHLRFGQRRDAAMSGGTT
jgi:high-affinity Fe2+/Pb2+ permease